MSYQDRVALLDQALLRLVAEPRQWPGQQSTDRAPYLRASWMQSPILGARAGQGSC